MDTQPRDERLSKLLDLGRSLVSELDLDRVLTRIVDAAVSLTGARYGALGVLDPSREELERFITVGIDEDGRREIGDLPRGRGVLGVLIRDPRPLRLHDVGSHIESFGFPAGHPPMRSFLGAPIRMGEDEIFGNLYLTEKQGAAAFDEEDQALLVALAEWAGIAIANARRFGGVSGRRTELERAVRAFETTSDIAQALAGETDLERILELVAKRSRALVGARATVIALLDGHELCIRQVAGEEVFTAISGTRVPLAGSLAGEVLDTGRARRFGELPPSGTMGAEVKVRSAVMVPLRFRGADLGVLAVYERLSGEPFDADDERLLTAFAFTAAPAVASAQNVAAEQLRRSMEASESERTRWARELHDETLQDLAAVKTLLSAARRSGDADQLASAVDTAIEHLQLGISGLRSLITDLRPAALDQLGTAAALRAFATRVGQISNVDVKLDLDLAYEAGRMPTRHEPDLEAATYRIVQEAVTNVVKHADAGEAVVTLREGDTHLDITVADDGRGIDPEVQQSGFGLTGMRERAMLVGGTVEVGPGSPGGTVVRARLPVRRRAGTGGRAHALGDRGAGTPERQAG